jgi:hypothetical protein
VKHVFVRDNGMGWYVRHNTVDRNPRRAHPDLNVERVIPWRGDCATTLVTFLAAEVRRLAPAVEVSSATGGLAA